MTHVPPAPPARPTARRLGAWLCPLLAWLTQLHAAEPTSTPTGPAPTARFESEIQAFAAADRQHPPTPGGILFVGSSIFRQWTNVADLMQPLPVLNRAFGGSRTDDQLVRFDQVVAPCAPRLIVYYCGSNDLKSGEMPEAIFERFQTFSDRVRAAFPKAWLVFVSSTRSPDRADRWDRVDRYNALVQGFCAATPRRTFVDVNPVLFGADGQPRLELYQDDRLHLRPAAYLGFSTILKPVLTRLWDGLAGEAPVPDTAPSKPPGLQEFLTCQLVPRLGNAWDYLFAPGAFPSVGWDRPEVVDHALGPFPLKVRWFDGTGLEVAKPERPGRYAFYAEGKTPGGLTVRRAATLFCRPPAWDGWSERPRAQLDFLPLDGLARAAWDEHRNAIADFAGRTVLLSVLRQREGAILLAWLGELQTTGAPAAPSDTPMIRDHEYHLALRRTVLGLEGRPATLAPPRHTDASPAAVLRPGSEQEAGFAPGTAGRLRDIARDWADQSREPFNLVVARHGVVVIDETFGAYSWGPLTRDTPTEMASITKLIAGLLFARFVDQGLIGIDDPVGRYLPDFPVAGASVLTLRHCFTHTTALEGHAEWGGLHNPWLDNVIANAAAQLRPGQVHTYNGMGYDLAGRVMEAVTGKSVFRLMREALFDPLELAHTTLEEDLGFSCFSTAADMAKIGQMLLNRGAYGDLVFFSPPTFQQLLPQPLSKFYPAIQDKEWGIGITWMRQPHPQAGTNGMARDATLLSRNVIGHGSATAAILRIDLDNNLVITQTRRRAGPGYDGHLARFLQAVDAGLVTAAPPAR